jgi:hypothetical protein
MTYESQGIKYISLYPPKKGGGYHDNLIQKIKPGGKRKSSLFTQWNPATKRGFRSIWRPPGAFSVLGFLKAPNLQVSLIIPHVTKKKRLKKRTLKSSLTHTPEIIDTLL